MGGVGVPPRIHFQDSGSLLPPLGDTKNSRYNPFSILQEGQPTSDDWLGEQNAVLLLLGRRIPLYSMSLNLSPARIR
jgi:hypothetical protein